VELDEDEVVAAAVLAVARDKVPDEWAGQRLDRVAIASARRVDIASRTFPDNLAPRSNARNATRE